MRIEPASRWHWLPWVVFAGALLACIAMMLRPQPYEFGAKNADKVAHAAGFCMLLLLAALATRHQPRVVTLWLTTLLALLAVVSEWVQSTSWLPLRAGSLDDAVANLVGLGLGALILVVLWLVRKSRRGRIATACRPAQE